MIQILSLTRRYTSPFLPFATQTRHGAGESALSRSTTSEYHGPVVLDHSANDWIATKGALSAVVEQIGGEAHKPRRRVSSNRKPSPQQSPDSYCFLRVAGSNSSTSMIIFSFSAHICISLLFSYSHVVNSAPRRHKACPRIGTGLLTPK